MSAVKSVENRLPVEILHVSDLHFWGIHRLDRARDLNWSALCRHVAEEIKEGRHNADLIAFTGDLVETPWVRSLRPFRRGVNALFELAGACGFVGRDLRWQQSDEAPPDEWWDLVGTRLFLVPGNHDVFLKGVRLGWIKWRKPFARLLDRIGVGDLAARIAGPLAILSLDSNGGRALYGAARGEVERQTALAWPEELGVSDSHLGVALVHGHPIQLPYFVDGLATEKRMVMENAGLLMRNLANLGVRLVLHGHRHLPGICSLTLPDSNGEPQPMVVVAAGSATLREKAWPFCCYDWVRIHADRRIEVTMARQEEGNNQYRLDAPYIADTGDFSYDQVSKRVEVDAETGDLNVCVKIQGFRASVGRPATSAIPFSVTTVKPPLGLAAWRFVVSAGGGPGTKLSWNREHTFLEISPPQRAEDPPLDLELRYYLHNAVALNRWEARQMSPEATPGHEFTTQRVTCQTQRLELEVELPATLFQRSAEKPFVKVHRDAGRLDQEESSACTAALKSEIKAKTGRLAMACRPRPPALYGLHWGLPDLVGSTVAIDLALNSIRSWQALVLREWNQDRRPLDRLAQGVSRVLEARGLGALDTGLFIADTSEVRQLLNPWLMGPTALRLVGSSVALSGSKEDLSLPFGGGVAGRALRTGRLMIYNRVEADHTENQYRVGTSIRPANYYQDLSDGPDYRALLAAPIFPLLLGNKNGISLSTAPYAAMVVSAGSREADHALLTAAAETVSKVMTDLCSRLEASVYVLGKARAAGPEAVTAQDANQLREYWE